MSKIDELLTKAVSLGQTALAITDHGNLYGAIEFYAKAKKYGIKPIIGVEAYLAARTRFDRVAKIDSKSSHLILLAKNTLGYKNLLKLVSAAQLEGFYYKPRIDLEILRQHNQGLIGLSGCLNGKISRLLLQANFEAAEKASLEFLEIFGPGNFYLEIGYHPGIEENNKVFPRLVKLGRQTGLPLVATCDIHYLNKEDKDVHDVFLAVQTGKKTDEEDRLTMRSDDFSLGAEEWLSQGFADQPEAIENTLKIASDCNLELKIGQTEIPPFDLPQGENYDSYLYKLAQAGLKRRGLEKSEQAQQRLAYELKVIAQAGFSSYFLIVQDLVNFAKDSGIKVGPGRGSAAGSLTAYALRITEIDPLRFKLLFERFLNPDRIAPPDIDMDFSDTRRDEVLAYLRRKYGERRVAQIVTFGKMAARAAVRDAGRALGLPYILCDQIAKLIPFNFSLEKSLKTVPELQKISKDNADAAHLLQIAKRLEGTVRHASVHASGVVITPTDLTDYVPIQPAPQDETRLITQYDMYSVEALGLLKIDILGLRTLSEIETAQNLIQERHQQEVSFPEDDKKVFEILAKGETVGVFQLEGRGITDYLIHLKPSSLEDIIAMVALYRPGPMELIPRYIKRKHKLEKIEYIHPKLEPILKDTYGIAVFQEQLLKIAQELAGFSLGEADVLRKAVGKKIQSLLEEQKQKMVSGMLKGGLDKTTAEKVWLWYEPFARYGFNRAHAACYAAIAYQTAYLRAHYPIEFLTAIFIHEGSDLERVKTIIDEAKRLGFKVLPPDINESNSKFTITAERTIRFGLGAIKNVGEKVVEQLERERQGGGRFTSLGNFLQRLQHKDLNRKSLESLIKAGALDSLGNRDLFLSNLDYLIEFQQKQKNSLYSANRLFGSSDELILRPGRSFAIEEKLGWEKELLGIYVSGHPFAAVAEKLNSKIKKIEELKQFKELNKARIGGVIGASKRIMTKRNEPMMTIELEDLSASIKIVFFPRAYQKHGLALQEGKIVVVTGNYDPGRGEMIGEEVVAVR